MLTFVTGLKLPRSARMFFLYLVDLLRIEGHGSLDDRYNVIVDIIKMLKYAESTQFIKDITGTIGADPLFKG